MSDIGNPFAELTRLRAINAELLDALQELLLNCDGYGEAFDEAYENAKTAVDKAAR